MRTSPWTRATCPTSTCGVTTKKHTGLVAHAVHLFYFFDSGRLSQPAQECLAVSREGGRGSVSTARASCKKGGYAGLIIRLSAQARKQCMAGEVVQPIAEWHLSQNSVISIHDMSQG